MYKNLTKFMESAVALSDELSFSRAATVAGITQSAVTKNIKELESLVGKPLFERSRRHVRITTPGKAYVDLARVSLIYSDRALNAARAASQRMDRIQYVGRSPYTDPFYLSTLLSVELPAYPQMRIELSSRYSYDLVHEILAGSLDLGIVNDPPPTALLSTLKLAKSPYYIGMSTSDPLAGKPFVTLDDLSNRSWIVFDRRLHPLLYDGIMLEAEQRRVRHLKLQHITEPEETYPFLASGGFLAFFTKAGAIRMARKSVTVRPLQEPSLQVTTYLVSAADNESKITGALARAFITKLKSTGHTPQPDETSPAA